MASEGKGRRFTLPLRKAVGSLFKRKATTKEVIRQPHLAFREYHKYHQRSEASQQTYDTNVDSLDTLVTLVNELPDNEVTHFRLPRRGDRSVVHPRPERCRSFDDVGVPKTTASPDSGISGVLTQTVDEEYGSRQPYYKLDQPSNYSPEIPEPAVIKQTVVRLPHPSQDSSHKSSSVPHTGIGGGYSGGVILNTNGPSKDSRRMTGVKTLPATPEDFKFNGNYQASEEYNDIITNGIAANASKPGATPSSLRSGWSGTTRRDPSVTNKIRAIRFSYSSASSTLDDSISLNSTPSTPAPDGLPRSQHSSVKDLLQLSDQNEPSNSLGRGSLMKRPVAQQAPVSVKEPIREESPLDFFKADSEEKEGACSASSANMTSTPSSPLQPPSQYLPDSQTPSSVDPNHPQVTSSPAGDHGISTRISRKLVPAKIPKGEERDLKDSSGGLEAEVSKKNSSSDVTAEAKIDIAEELSKPASICIESSAEWSEEDETDFMKIFSNVPVVIQDSMGDSQAANAIIDTGSSSSFISKHLTQQYSLLERPLSSEDIQTFGAFADSEHTPTTFVALQLKCSNIGLNEFVRVQVRVLDVEKFDIIFGRPFIQKHGILNNLLTRPQSNGPTKTLFVVQQKDSDDTNTRGTDCATPGDPTTAFRSSCAIPYPSLPEIEESIPNEDPATLFSNSSEHESSSMEESDSDDESVIEFAGQPSFDEILPSAFDVAENEEKLARLLGPMKQAMVDRLMAEFMEIFGQNWTEGTRKCTASPESSQYIAEDKVSSKKSRKDKVKKRSRETEDNESSEEKNGGPPKRHRQKPNPEDSSDTGNSFACPYRKYDPRTYCAHSRKWRTCAMTAFPDVSRVKSHLYRSHMIYQCTRCKDTFRTEEMLKEHSGAAVECERYQLKEAEGVRGVNADIERRLRSRKQDGSPKDRWIKIFTMLFGDNNVPTPYFEPVVEEMNFMGNASSPDSRQLTDFEEYLREELPRAIESNLQRAAQNQLRSIEAGLRRSLHDMIRDSQDEVFSRYRSRIASTGESSSTNPFDGDAPHIRGEQSTHSTALPLSNAETPPQERQLERLGSFFSQPPHQMNPRQSIELSTADTTNPHEDNAFSDSGYQADSVINATDPVTSWNIMDARDPQRLTEIRLRTSKNQESSAIPINDLESDNNLLLTVNGEENRAPEAPMFECPITAEYQPYQMITNYDHEDMWAGVVFEN